ncbi:UDP-glucose 4-epimerase GalE [Thioalkalivibrio versutus]|uniref:UDP-glucose 4-epimerase GalE n=1 Tax=Thioalkalivibrio versutus TaxID=106634 RepID=UPI00035E46B9|nr:UDP-glucose 4-epimerase GalE [Thioalkalivibrio versutus]OOC47841.1 UDP-glucose 4-epimerase GalE [Thioalkalivibrio versutus]
MNTGVVLVVGGAGYIGSHMVKYLREAGREVVVLDNLSSGYRDAVAGVPLVEGDMGDRAVLDVLFQRYAVDAVMHFAGYIEVGESVRDPGKYYRNNVSHTLELLDAMVRHGVDKLIFSSTAAVYGEPCYKPIDESHPREPINPYGRSKQMVEAILADYERAHGLRSVSLRYFNAAGADPEGELAERHDPETHLIPIILEAAAGKRPHIAVYGRDYPTADGTCVRDYVHVQDLCRAHLLALEHLRQGAASAAFNLGNGGGFSVQQVIDVAREVTGQPIAVVDEARREGDPAVLVADATAAREVLGWQPVHDRLEPIIEHAWKAGQEILYQDFE